MSRLGTHMRMMILRSPAAPVSDCEKAPVPPYGLVSSPRTWAARRLEALSIALPTSRASTGPTLRGRVRAPATDVCAAENPETSTSPRRSTAAASRREADGMASPTGSPTSRSAKDSRGADGPLWTFHAASVGIHGRGDARRSRADGRLQHGAPGRPVATPTRGSATLQ